LELSSFPRLLLLVKKQGMSCLPLYNGGIQVRALLLLKEVDVRTALHATQKPLEVQA